MTDYVLELQRRGDHVRNYLKDNTNELMAPLSNLPLATSESHFCTLDYPVDFKNPRRLRIIISYRRGTEGTDETYRAPISFYLDGFKEDPMTAAVEHAHEAVTKEIARLVEDITDDYQGTEHWAG